MTAQTTLHSTSAPDPSQDSTSQSTVGPAEWWERAACRDRNSELFFHADRERGPARASRAAKAKAVCAACPVMLLCREYALAQPEPYGIWGGLDEHERAELLSRQAS
jgi:WhiB family redox-sensing transcriptional regulator